MVTKIYIKNRHGLKIAVRLNLEDCNSKLVLLEHGLSARKEYPHMLVLEEVFAKHGYNVINFDATNSLNESESSDNGITVSGHFEDLEDVINWVKTQKFYSEPFALAGQSLGSLSVVRYAGTYPQEINLLIPCAFPYINGEIKLGNDSIALEILKNGYFDKVSKSTGRILKMKMPWVEDLKKLNLVPYIKKITADTFVVIGSKDSDIHIDSSKELYELLNCKKSFYMLENIPHDLANTEQDKKLFTKTINDVLNKQEKENCISC